MYRPSSYRNLPLPKQALDTSTEEEVAARHQRTCRQEEDSSLEEATMEDTLQEEVGAV